MNLKKTIASTPLFEFETKEFPTTRYQGSKAKIVDWISNVLSKLEFLSFLDAFGGTGSVAYKFKTMGKAVTYNDILHFNYLFGKALIENNGTKLAPKDIEWILSPHEGIVYPNFIETTFANIYFTDEENKWLDRTITNINQISDPFKHALAFFALSQACIIKRPYNLFHRKNLYVRFADVPRSFGNKTSWDRPFIEWFTYFCYEANQAVFDNGVNNYAINRDAMDVDGKFDLVYIDTPYISKNGVGINYRDFYHFLEGLTDYKNWGRNIDMKSKHRKLISSASEWANKKEIYCAFDNLFNRFKDSIIVVSYRSNGLPSETDLVKILNKYKMNVRVEYYGNYKYALSHDMDTKEILLIGE